MSEQQVAVARSYLKARHKSDNLQYQYDCARERIAAYETSYVDETFAKESTSSLEEFRAMGVRVSKFLGNVAAVGAAVFGADLIFTAGYSMTAMNGVFLTLTGVTTVGAGLGIAVSTGAKRNVGVELAARAARSPNIADDREALTKIAIAMRESEQDLNQAERDMRVNFGVSKRMDFAREAAEVIAAADRATAAQDSARGFSIER